MSPFNPSFQDRAGQSADAKQKALEQLRNKPPLDDKTIAERKAAELRRETARAEKGAAKKAAEAAAAELSAAAAAASAPPSDAERKAARDARYAARKNRR